MNESEDIVAIIGDKTNRMIITLLTTNELSSKQISERLDLAPSTTYRKLSVLEQMQIIKKTKVMRTLEGLDESYYKSWVSEINVKFKDGEISYKLERVKMEDKIVRLWQKFKE